MMPRGIYERRSIEERLLAYRQIDEQTGCWLFAKARTEKGYGRIWFEGKMWRVHRVALLVFKGIQLGPRLGLHDCDTPGCFNPDHVHPGTPRENSIDSVNRLRHVNAKKTHCKRGHPFNSENTRIRHRGGHIWRECIACDQLRAAA